MSSAVHLPGWWTGLASLGRWLGKSPKEKPEPYPGEVPSLWGEGTCVGLFQSRTKEFQLWLGHDLNLTSDPITSWQTDEEAMETVTDFISLGSKVQMVTAAMKLKDACSLEGEGNGTPLQYSCLENSMDGGAW